MLKVLSCGFLVALLILVSIGCSYAGDASFMIRPQFGIGIVNNGEDGRSGTAVHGGVRLLRNANDYQRWGLELTSIDTPRNDSARHTRFTAFGIVLEQRLWSWFNMSIGTVGYIGSIGQSKNPFGILTNLGWEPITTSCLKPFITYRADMIFSEHTTTINSISAGLSW